jgi:hypothetical protein
MEQDCSCRRPKLWTSSTFYLLPLSLILCTQVWQMLYFPQWCLKPQFLFHFLRSEKENHSLSNIIRELMINELQKCGNKISKNETQVWAQVSQTPNTLCLIKKINYKKKTRTNGKWQHIFHGIIFVVHDILYKNMILLISNLQNMLQSL